MSLTTNHDELVVELAPDPVPCPTTIARRQRRLEELAWHEFADGPPERTPRSALARAARHYLAEFGIWVKNCAVCGTAFASKRSDAVTCTEACRKRQQRERSR